MSRGLGSVQREILATLHEAKAAPLRYAGGRAAPPLGKPGRVLLNGYEFDLPDGVYDLRASLRFLAERHGVTYGKKDEMYPHGQYISENFRISFYRAARSLIRRGHLQWCTHQGQVQQAGPDKGKEGRFVCRAEPGEDVSHG